MSEIEVPKVRGRRPDEGRMYDIDFLDATEAIMEYSENGIIPMKDQPRHVQQFERYVMDHFKSSISGIDADKIMFTPDVRNGLEKGARFGVVATRSMPAELDFFDGDSNSLYSAGSPILDIHISRVFFDKEAKMQALPIDYFTKSFESLANYLRLKPDVPEAIVGLTHPRMAKLSKRWGFEVVQKPFHPDVYKFGDEVLAYFEDKRDEEDHMYHYQAIKLLMNQSLLHQTRDKFVANHINSRFGF